MLNNLLLSTKTVLPIVLLVCVGMFLKKIKLLPDAFYSGADKFVFKVALPSMIFLEVARSDISESASFFRLPLYVVPMICLFCVVFSVLMALAIKDRRRVGASVQSMFRSNAAILGVVLIQNMFDDPEQVTVGLAAYAVTMPFVVLAYNALSVIVLTVFMPVAEGEEKKKLGFADVGRILLETVKNPLIIAVVLGLPFMFFRIPLPTIVTGTMNYLSGCTTGLALISLGAGFSFDALRGNLGLASFVTAVKTVFLPAVTVSLGYALGFRGIELMIIFVIFGTPAAVSSYIMSKNMKSDHELSGQILLLSTIVCIFTIFAGTFLMRTIGIV